MFPLTRNQPGQQPQGKPFQPRPPDQPAQPDRAKLISDFIEELRKCSGAFRWVLTEVNCRNLPMLRGYRADWPHPFCPITAVHFARTGDRQRTVAAHGLAERHGWATFSLDVAIAADDKIDCILGQRLRKAVGMKVKD